MKKPLSFILIIMLAVCSIPLTACGSPGYKVTSVKELKSDESEAAVQLVTALAHLEDCGDDDLICILDKSFSDSTVIPTEQEGSPVVYVTSEDNFPETKVSKLEIPEGVKYVEYVFPSESYANLSLKSVSIPKDCTVANSFKDCDELEEVNAAGASKIESSFIKCKSLKNADISDVESIDNSFTTCNSLESVNLKGVQYTGDSFIDCAALSDVDLSGIVDFGGSFKKCKSLKSVKPSSATSIMDAFWECDALETVDLTGIEVVSSSFLECPSIKTLDLADVDHTIESFSNCDGLESVSIPKATELKGTFEECKSLKTVTGASELIDIQESFRECPALESIPYMPKLESVYTSFENCDSIKSTEFAGKANRVRYSFNECDKLEKVAFSAVYKIEKCFENCNAIKTVTCTYAAALEGSTDNGENGTDEENAPGMKIYSCFSGIKALTTATINGTIWKIEGSFNNLPEFTTFNYTSLRAYTSSFSNCPKLKTEIMTDEEIKAKKEAEEEEERKAEEERKKQEELDNEPYGPGQSGLQLSASSEKEAFFRLLKMNSDVEFSVHLDAGESTTEYFPSGRYVLEVIRGTDWDSEKETFGSISNHVYSEIYTFEDGAVYEISTGDRSDFRSSNPLDN